MPNDQENWKRLNDLSALSEDEMNQRMRDLAPLMRNVPPEERHNQYGMAAVNKTEYNFWDDEVAVQRLYGTPPDFQRYSRKPKQPNLFRRLLSFLKSILSLK